MVLLSVLLACATRARPEAPAVDQPAPRPEVVSRALPAERSVRDAPPVLKAGDSGLAGIADTRVALVTAHGEATYYANKFDGRLTASGIRFRNSELFAAHREYPFGTIVRITNLKNSRSVVVRVVDRGPNGTAENKRRTIIDVSQRAAQALDFLRDGRIRVRVEVLEWGTNPRPGRQP
jgi:rare lipoprotein A